MANANAATAPAAPVVPPAAVAKSASKKKLIIIAAAAVVIAGGAAGFFLHGSGEPAAQADSKGNSKGDKKKAVAEKKAAPKAPALYIPLDPAFVVNFDAGSSARFLQVAVQLMTRDAPTAEFIKQHDPAIRNDLLLLLGNVKFEGVQTREGKEALRQSSLEAVRQIIKSEGGEPDKLEAVYFTSFVMQ
jgi:flagellar FliL protein